MFIKRPSEVAEHEGSAGHARWRCNGRHQPNVFVLNEVDSRTMQGKIFTNLFIAGELLDLDGPIGGYNFQAAFSKRRSKARMFEPASRRFSGLGPEIS